MLAHQGGWDEILMVVGPMLVIGGILAVARRRVSRIDPDTSDPDTSDPHTSDPGTSANG